MNRPIEDRVRAALKARAETVTPQSVSSGHNSTQARRVGTGPSPRRWIWPAVTAAAVVVIVSGTTTAITVADRQRPGVSTPTSSSTAASTKSLNSITYRKPSPTPSVARSEATATPRITKPPVAARPAPSSNASVAGSNSSSGPASAPACGTASLTVRFVPGQSVASQAGNLVVFTNTSVSTCTMTGYPTLTMQGHPSSTPSAASTDLPINTRHGGGYTFSDPGPSPVLVQPGASASFIFGTQNANASPYQVTALRITPPGSTTPMILNVSILEDANAAASITAVFTGSQFPAR